MFSSESNRARKFILRNVYQRRLNGKFNFHVDFSWWFSLRLRNRDLIGNLIKINNQLNSIDVKTWAFLFGLNQYRAWEEWTGEKKISFTTLMSLTGAREINEMLFKVIYFLCRTSRKSFRSFNLARQGERLNDVKIENLQIIEPENESLEHPCGFVWVGVKLEFLKTALSLMVRKTEEQ